MTEEVDLKIGSFYWVLIVLDPDAASADGSDGLGWENRVMPARYAGKNTTGEHLWNYLGQDDESDWPVRWIGDELIPAR